MRPDEINHELAQVAARHHGLITQEQAAAVGVHPDALRRRVAAGYLQQLDRQTYRFAGAPVTWGQRALLACHGAGADAVLSHRAAAHAWRLDGFERAPLEVTVPRWHRRVRRPNTIVHESTDLIAADTREVDRIPTTSPVRTLVDLGAVANRYRVEQALEDALRRSLCSAEQVAQRFSQLARRGKRGVTILRPLLEERVGETVPTHSMLERRLVRIIESLPVATPVRQHPVHLRDTTVYLDLAWPDRMIAVEGDGLYAHGTNLQLPWDVDRQTELVLLGWHVLRFSWKAVVDQPGAVADQILRAHRRFEPSA